MNENSAIDSSQMHQPFDPKRIYRVTPLADEADIGPRSIYQAIARGELVAHKVNRRGDLRVTGAAANAWWHRQRVRA